MRLEQPVYVPRPEDICTPALRNFYGRLPRKTLVMGILNVTPDSFSDGGQYASLQDAVSHGVRMAAEGADVIDVGGESTRPGSDAVSVDAELERVLPVILELSKRVDVPISVDTSKAEVAEVALTSGAHIVNDVTGLQNDPRLAKVAARHQAPLVLMHMKGTPKSMQQETQYNNLVGEINEFFRQQLAVAKDAGLREEWIILDPGFGFAKNPEQNLELIRRLGEFKVHGRPVMIGTSRKSTLGKLLGGAPPLERVEATAATVALSIVQGADIVRVHDVREMVRVATVTDAIARARSPEATP